LLAARSSRLLESLTTEEKISTLTIDSLPSQRPRFAFEMRGQREAKQFQDRRRHIHNRRLLFDEFAA